MTNLCESVWLCPGPSVNELHSSTVNFIGKKVGAACDACLFAQAQILDAAPTANTSAAVPIYLSLFPLPHPLRILSASSPRCRSASRANSRLLSLPVLGTCCSCVHAGHEVLSQTAAKQCLPPTSRTMDWRSQGTGRYGDR